MKEGLRVGVMVGLRVGVMVGVTPTRVGVSWG